MRKAAQLLSMILVFSLLLTTGAYASPAGYDSLTGFPGQETDASITVGTEVRDEQDVVLDDAGTDTDHTALYAVGPDADAHVTGEVRLEDSAQNIGACFPSGRGAALVAHDGAALTAEDIKIETEGFSHAGLLLSDGANATVRDSEITVLGGDPQSLGGEGYGNTPDESVAYTAPWPLGVSGGSRAIGLVGDAPGLSLVGSSVTAANWGVLYAGLGRDAAVTAVDSDLAILPAGEGGLDAGTELLGYDPQVYGSGYGLYSAGGADAYLYGSSITGATCGAVLNGAGESYFGPSDGTVLLYEGDHLAGSVTGQGRAASIKSVFGFLMTGDAGSVTVDDRTSVETADAVVLYKDGDGAFTFRNARLRSDSGVLLQMMDSDDDDRIGLLNGVYGYSPVYDERNLTETSGGQDALPDSPEQDAAAQAEEENDDSAVPSGALPPAAQPRTLSVTYTNGLYTGDIYNGTGYYGQPGDSLTVTVGPGAVLSGDVCLTVSFKAIPYTPQAAQALEPYGDHIHYAFLDADGTPCQEDQAAYIQFTRYTMDEYYLQGHVQDLPYYNGDAGLDVTVAQGGTWVVEETSLLTGLTVEDGGTVYGQLRDDHDGSLTLTPADEPLAPGVYVSEPEEDHAEAEALAEADAPGETEAPAETDVLDEVEPPAETETPDETEAPDETDVPDETAASTETAAVRPVIFRENRSIPPWKPLTSPSESCIIPIAVWRRSSVG